jgi:hypothetical protein
MVSTRCAPDKSRISVNWSDSEWASGNKSEVSNATTTILDDLVYHQWQIINPAALTEVADQAQDAITFYGLINVGLSSRLHSYFPSNSRKPLLLQRQRPLSLAYEIGTHLKVHNLFNRTGTLTNSTDTSFSTQPIKRYTTQKQLMRCL